MSGTLAVRWTEPTDHGGSDTTSYKIQWRSGTEGHRARCCLMMESYRFHGFDPTHESRRAAGAPMPNVPEPWSLAYVERLLSAGRNVHERDKRGLTLLHHAARFAKDFVVLGRLMHAGAHANATDNRGWTPLHWAAAFNESYDVIDLMRTLCATHETEEAKAIATSVAIE